MFITVRKTDMWSYNFSLVLIFPADETVSDVAREWSEPANPMSLLSDWELIDPKVYCQNPNWTIIWNNSAKKLKHSSDWRSAGQDASQMNTASKVSFSDCLNCFCNVIIALSKTHFYLLLLATVCILFIYFFSFNKIGRCNVVVIYD